MNTAQAPDGGCDGLQHSPLRFGRRSDARLLDHLAAMQLQLGVAAISPAETTKEHRTQQQRARSVPNVLYNTTTLVTTHVTSGCLL